MYINLKLLFTLRRYLDLLNKKAYKILIFYYFILLYTVHSNGFVKQYSLLYFFYVIPVYLFVVINIPLILTTAFNKQTRLLYIFVCIVFFISACRLDFQSISNIGGITFLLIIIVNSQLCVSLKFINSLFLTAICCSFVAYLFNQNVYGLVPGFGKTNIIDTIDTGVRVSLFPNIIESSLFSVFVFIVNFSFNKSKSIFLFTPLALYFILFSGNRTSIILVIIFVSLFLLFKIVKIKHRRFYLIFPFLLISMLIITYNPFVIASISNNLDSAFLKTLLFRSIEDSEIETNMQNTLIRLWIWDQHMIVFLQSPFIGVGTFDFTKIANEHDFLKEIPSDGTESFITGLLARVGIVASFFFAFFIVYINKAILLGKKFSYTIPIMLLYVLFFYASFFTAYNFITLLWFGMFNFEDRINQIATNA